MALDLIRDYKPELVKMMKDVLNDSNAQFKLDQYEADLNKLIIQIHNSETKNMQLGQKYHNLLNSLYSNVPDANLSALKAINTQSTTLDVELQRIINTLFQKEHEILDYLTKGLAATTTYAIYFSAPDSQSVIRGEIKSEDLYNSDALNITASGISLYHSNVVKLFQTQGTSSQLTPEQIARYSEIVQAAINNMKDAFEQLKKELGELRGRMAHQHLGDVLWHKYQNLKRLVGNEYQINGLYASYMFGLLTDSDHRTSLKGAFMNRGHIYEALERYVQGDTRAPTELLGESIGHDPWWTQGDVGTIQVKSLVGNQTNYQSVVKIASMDSILRVAGFLQTLLAARRKDLQYLDPKISAILDQQIKDGADHSGVFISKTIQALLTELHNS